MYNKVPNPIEEANVELNLQTLFRLSGRAVDLNRVKELTQILDAASDPRAEKGHKLTKELS